ncbi:MULTISPECIES: hypothetical protein [unclassified Salinibacterium]|uniref:hypothetical protein n=1 Tax=unclassified Salinibacterium TaxID=2632331 RepID=UPI00164EDD2F|nr:MULTISPECIES: hypothetical protein [unclassified Salinibacterium]
MQWWNDLVDWLNSDDGWRVISTAVIPFLAIVVAGVVAALIGRGSARRVIAHAEQERRIATVAALISGARRAARWNALSHPEQQHAEHLLHDADTRLRLLPLNGSSMVADWAAHEIEEMKRNSVSFSFQAEQSLIEFRNRLVDWQMRPGRAKKLFKADLDTWAYEAGQADQDLVNKQKEWAKQQVNETEPVLNASNAASSTVSPTPERGDAASTPSFGDATPSAFTAPSYALPQSLASREDDAPVQDWAAAAPADQPTAAAETPRSSEMPGSDEDTTTGESPLAPGPVSAGTVRQRIAPEERDY